MSNLRGFTIKNEPNKRILDKRIACFLFPQINRVTTRIMKNIQLPSCEIPKKNQFRAGVEIVCIMRIISSSRIEISPNSEYFLSTSRN